MYKIISFKNSLLIFLILFSFFLRFFKLSEFPITLNHDEISQLYDAISIAQTGKDVYGNFLPIVLTSTGDYKAAYYTYLSIIPYWIFGSQDFVIRVVTAFFGSLTTLAAFLFINSLTKNWKLALFCAFALCITPSEIFYARKSFESIIGVCLALFGLFFLSENIKGKNNYFKLILGVIFLSLAMYIYTAYTIVVPSVLILFHLIFYKNIKEQKNKIILGFLIWVVFLIPLLFLALTNAGLRFRAETVFLSQDVNLGRYITITQNPAKSYFDFAFTKYLNQFNPTFLFINGLDLTNYDIFGLGPLLIWQFPFIILGIAFLTKSRIYSKLGLFLFGAIIFAFIPSAITFENYSPHRAVFAFTILAIISGIGFYYFLKLVKWRFIIFFVLAALILNLIYAIRIYTVSYSYDKSEKLQYPFEKVVSYIWSQYDNFDTIIFDPQFGDVAPITGVGIPYYLGYYGNIHPSRIQEEYIFGKDEQRFGKIIIRGVTWWDDIKLKNTLLIVSPWSFPIDKMDKNAIVERFDFYNGKPAFFAIRY